MLIHPWDAAIADDEWLAFVRAYEWGVLIAAGRGRDVPVAVPTQFVLADPSTVLLHLARPNPIWAAIDENPAVLLVVSGDWAYIPAAWKTIGEEDPRLGIPTTFYASVQLTCRAHAVTDDTGKAEILRGQLARLQPGTDVADPAGHGRVLSGLQGLRLDIRDVRAKFKYGGNLDDAHRAAIADRLAERGGPGDLAALAHLRRREGARPARP